MLWEHGNYSPFQVPNTRPVKNISPLIADCFVTFSYLFFSFILSYCIVHLRIVGQRKTKHTKPPIVAVHNIYVDFHEKNFFGFDIIKISSTFYDFNNKFSFHSWN